MERHELILIGILTATLAFNAGATTSDAQAARGSGAGDACSLLTHDEIGAAAGTVVRESRPRVVPEGSECRYQTRAGFTLTITISGVDPKDFDELRELFGDEATPVTGVGDAAYFLDTQRIYVRVGRHQLVVSRGDAGDAKSREGLLAIAKLAVPKL